MERLYIYVCTYDQRQKDRHQQHLWLRAWATNRAVYGFSKKQVSFKFTTKNVFIYSDNYWLKSSKTLCQILEPIWAIAVVLTQLVNKLNHYFGLGSIPKPKSWFANTFGRYGNQLLKPQISDLVICLHRKCGVFFSPK